MYKHVPLKTWLQAARLRTLPLAIATIILGTLLAVYYGSFKADVLILSILTAINYQVLSNFANDLGDGQKGTDINRQGEKRAIASGEISVQQMKRAVVLFTILSLLSGTYLSILATQNLPLFITIGFILLGALATVAALTYTMGKRAYGYSGWGDFFVLVFFGWVGVLGANFLHTNAVILPLFLPASAVGFLAMGVLNLNNMRDINNDAAAGKNTLVVKMGLQKAKRYHLVLLSMAVVFQTIFVLVTQPGWGGFLFILVLPLLIKNGRSAWRASRPKDFEPLLKPLAISTLLFCILAGIGQNLTQIFSQ